MAEISVIIPCYNVAKWVPRCLECVVRQTIGLDKLEIICVDDCSTDETVKVLEDWEKKYPKNILIVKCEVNARQGTARNIGLQYASGEWIVFLDSDDWIELDYIEKLYTAAMDGDYDIVSCGHKRDFSKELTFFNDRPTCISDGKSYMIDSDEERREHIIIPQIGYSAWAKIIRKKLLLDNAIYFPENVTYEDAGWGSLLNLYFNKAYKIDEPLYHYFVNDESTVLRGNSNHHLDCLTVQTWLWREYIKRGFWNRFKNELEMEHIYSCYLAGMKMLILRYEKPDYNIYLLLRELMLDRIGNYKDNMYIKQGRLDEKYMLMLTALDVQLGKSQFYELADCVKKIGI